MVKLSRYAHLFDLGDAVALYHSLRMKPVYLKKQEYKDLQAFIADPSCFSNLQDFSNLSKTIECLRKYKIVIDKDSDDDNVLSIVKNKIPHPAISICYFILSEQCNLACKYCFLGNNNKILREKFLQKNMTFEIADKAIEFFIRQIKITNKKITDDFKPSVIFYGGEPLINFETLEYIARKFNYLRNKEDVIKNLELSVVTNGTLLNEEKIRILKELNIGIGISIDGFTDKANSNRITKDGRAVFKDVLKNIELCKKNNVQISLSVTLSEETINDIDSVYRLIDTYNIKSLGFNIMMSSESFVVSTDYVEKATDFIIKAFISLRKKGIYEDRIMRKLNSFASSRIYFSDCAATSGSQIVIAPDGRVGICHGFLLDKKYFISDVNDNSFVASENTFFKEWSRLSPIIKEECQSCCALGICGGGCPVNAIYLKKGNTIHSIDERFCIHAKKTLNFFIHDLYNIIKKRINENK